MTRRSRLARVVHLLVLLALLPGVSWAQTVDPTYLRSPIASPIARAEVPNDQLVIGGIIGGAAGLAAGALIGFGLDQRSDCTGEYCKVDGLILGGLLGETLGIALGVHLAAHRETSFTDGLLASTAVGVIGLFVAGATGGLPLVLVPPLQIAAAISFSR